MRTGKKLSYIVISNQLIKNMWGDRKKILLANYKESCFRYELNIPSPKGEGFSEATESGGSD